MIFILFLASAATIEVILRYDENKQRQVKARTSSGGAVPTTESLVALMNTLDRHGRGKVPVIDTEVATSRNAGVRAYATIEKDI